MSSWICVDSGIALKLVLDEPDSLSAERLWQSWLEQDYHLIAPSLFVFEIVSVLRKTVHRGLLTPEQGRRAIDEALALDVHLTAFRDLHERAWEIAHELERPAAYDAHYLALAEIVGCEFWTADRRFYRIAHPRFPFIRWLGNYAPPTN
ncbi:MAG: type II toxin-antitoxin system VapC family toxin [Chloroflexi bacterium]|nr:type II toxin-antitoxin system VapC family toxin [Chloroflexota bacterium]